MAQGRIGYGTAKQREGKVDGIWMKGTWCKNMETK